MAQDHKKLAALMFGGILVYNPAFFTRRMSMGCTSVNIFWCSLAEKHTQRWF